MANFNRAADEAQKLVKSLEDLTVRRLMIRLSLIESELKGTPEGRRLTSAINRLDAALQNADRALVNVYAPRGPR
jgi:hypothetical protein